jgi:hypothetical protein
MIQFNGEKLLTFNDLASICRSARVLPSPGDPP